MKKLLILSLLCSQFAFANQLISPQKVKELGFDGVEKIIDFKKYDKGSVVIFISKDCPCSKGNLSYINKLSQEFKEFNFLAIHSKKNTSDEEIKNYLSDKNLNFSTYNDSDLKIADNFQALKTPHAFIVNHDGEVIYSGGVTNSTNPENAQSHYLKEALNEFIATKKILQSETKTLGCYITR